MYGLKDHPGDEDPSLGTPMKPAPFRPVLFMRVDSGPKGLTFERAAVRGRNAPALSVIEVCCLPSLRIETWGTSAVFGNRAAE